MKKMCALVPAVIVLALHADAQSTSFRLPEGQDFTDPDRRPFSLSADGRRMTYVARALLFVKDTAGGEPTVVRGPVEARGKSNPIF